MKRLLYLLSACLMTFGFSACNDDDDNLKLQDISVEFAVSEAGMDGETVSLGLKLSRATTELGRNDGNDLFGRIRRGHHDDPGHDRRQDHGQYSGRTVHGHFHRSQSDG